MPRPALLVLLAALSACSPRPPTSPRHEVRAEPPASDVAAPQESAALWVERSRLAAEAGVPDVAAAHLGRAAALEPTPARLWAHVDALVNAGEHRRARGVLERARVDARLADPAVVEQIDVRLAALPQPVARSIAATPPAGPLRAAYEAEAAGRPDAAAALVAALAGDAEPYHLARAAELLWSRGAHVKARRLAARARVQLHEAGATVQPIPVAQWHTAGAARRGDSLALLRHLDPLSPLLGEPAGALELWPERLAAAPDHRLHLARAATVFAVSADGATLVHDDRGAVVFRDMLSGTEMRRLAVDGERVLALAVDGAGDDLRVLVGAASGVSLWTARGEQEGRWKLAGSTPTIIRRYTGEGSHHLNILQDSPTWPVALAIAPGARLVAIGGSDSKVRLVDRTRGGVRELAFDWQYLERRHRGGDPDLNLPLALRFRAGGSELVAVHAHGDLLIWDTARAAVRRRLAGACSLAEAEESANRYNEPDAPRRPATADEREGCGRAVSAAISPDGTLVATGGSFAGVRVRDAATGAAIAMLVDEELPDRYLSFAPSGELALVDLYGARSLWRRGTAQAEQLAPPEPSGSIEPQLAPAGRLLEFSVDRTPVVWDLRDRRPIDAVRPGERLLAIAPDGRLAAVLSGGGLVLRDLPEGTVRHRVPDAGYARDVRAQLSAGHVLIHMSTMTGSHLTLVDLASVAARPLPPAIVERNLVLSADGRWIAGYHPFEPPKVWSTGTGEHAFTLDRETHDVAFARDGSFVAWLVQPEFGKPRVVLRALALHGKSPVRELAADGFAEAIAVTPGGDVLALLQSGALLRWTPSTGASRRVEDRWLIGMHGIVAADDDRTVVLTGFHRADIRRNDDALARLASVFPLPTRGWLALSQAGAVDGSGDAAAHLIVRVAGEGGEFVAGGRLVWDALHRDDLLARAFAGEDTPPPVALPAPPPAK